MILSVPYQFLTRRKKIPCNFDKKWISIFHITMMVTYKKNCSFALYFVSLNLFSIKVFSEHPVYTWDTPMICLRNAWDILEVDRIYLKYTWDIFLISQDIPEIYLRYTWDIPATYTRDVLYCTVLYYVIYSCWLKEIS